MNKSETKLWNAFGCLLFNKKESEAIDLINSHPDEISQICKDCLLEKGTRYGSVKIIHFLVDLGGNPTGNQGAIFHAACSQSPEILLYFINDCGMDVNSRHYNETGLEVAFRYGKLTNIDILLDAGANIDQDKISYIVAQGKSETLIQKAIEIGINPTKIFENMLIDLITTYADDGHNKIYGLLHQKCLRKLTEFDIDYVKAIKNIKFPDYYLDNTLMIRDD
jgi:hypothetical protein